MTGPLRPKGAEDTEMLSFVSSAPSSPSTAEIRPTIPLGGTTLPSTAGSATPPKTTLVQQFSNMFKNLFSSSTTDSSPPKSDQMASQAFFMHSAFGLLPDAVLHESTYSSQIEDGVKDLETQIRQERNERGGASRKSASL